MCGGCRRCLRLAAERRTRPGRRGPSSRAKDANPTTGTKPGPPSVGRLVLTLVDELRWRHPPVDFRYAPMRTSSSGLPRGVLRAVTEDGRGPPATEGRRHGGARGERARLRCVARSRVVSRAHAAADLVRAQARALKMPGLSSRLRGPRSRRAHVACRFGRQAAPPCRALPRAQADRQRRLRSGRRHRREARARARARRGDRTRRKRPARRIDRHRQDAPRDRTPGARSSRRFARYPNFPKNDLALCAQPS